MDEHQLRIILEAEDRTVAVINRIKANIRSIPTNLVFGGTGNAGGGAGSLNASQRQMQAHFNKLMQQLQAHSLKTQQQQQAHNQRIQQIVQAGNATQANQAQAHANRIIQIGQQFSNRQSTQAAQNQSRQNLQNQRFFQQQQNLATRHANMMAQIAARQANQTPRNIFAGWNPIGAVGQAAGGVSQIGGAILGVVSQLERAFSLARQVASVLVNEVVAAFRAVERSAMAASLAAAGIVTLISHAGITFDTFKENTLLTLEAMTKSAHTAKEIYDYAFRLAIPAKFTFEEVLEGARTLEAFGLKLNTYGSQQGRFLNASVALAQGMEKPLAQVTRFLGSVSQGRYLLQQAAPLGLGRATLEKHGVEFDERGAPKDRGKLIGAVMAEIEAKWGTLLEKMKNTFESRLDAMLSFGHMFAGKLAEGMFKRFGEGFSNIAKFFTNILNSTAPATVRMVKGLQVPFTLIGELFKRLTEQLPAIQGWMEKVFSQKNVISVLASVGAAIAMVANDIRDLIDHVTGRKGLQGAWEAFKDAFMDVIDIASRAWGAFIETIKYVSDHRDEIWGAFLDALGVAKTLFEALVGTVVILFGGKALQGVGDMASGLLKLLGPLGKVLGTFLKIADTVQAIRFALGMGGSAAAAAAAQAPDDPMAPALGPGGGGWGKSPGNPGAPGSRINPNANPNLAPYVGSPQLGSDAAQGAIGGAAAVGRWAIGEAGKFVNGQIPDRAKKIFGGAAAAGQWGWDNYGVKKRYNEFQRRKRDAEKGIYGVYGGAEAGDANAINPNLPPSNMLYGQGRGVGGAGFNNGVDEDVLKSQIDAMEAYFKSIRDPNERDQKRAGGVGLYRQYAGMKAAGVQSAYGTMQKAYGNLQGAARSGDRQKYDLFMEGDDIAGVVGYKKAVQEYNKAQEEYFKAMQDVNDVLKDSQDARFKQISEMRDAQEAMAKAEVELLPESQQVQAAAASLMPILMAEQKDILGKMGTVKANSLEYYKLREEYLKKEKEMLDLQNKATEDLVKKSYDMPQKQFGTLKKLIGVLPKGYQGRAAQRLLMPRVQQMIQAAGMESDPEKRQELLLSAADAFSEAEGMIKESDPFKGAFGVQGRGEAASRSLALQSLNDRRAGIFRYSRGHSRVGRLQSAFAGMSPFAPSMDNSGGANGGDAFTQIILNIAPNASVEQINDAVQRLLNQQLSRSFGR